MRRAMLAALVACVLLFPNVAAAQNEPMTRDGEAQTILLAEEGQRSSHTFIHRNQGKMSATAIGAGIGVIGGPIGIAIGGGVGFIIGLFVDRD